MNVESEKINLFQSSSYRHLNHAFPFIGLTGFNASVTGSRRLILKVVFSFQLRGSNVNSRPFVFFKQRTDHHTERVVLSLQYL
jgi:hypothetical protein